MVLDEKCCRRLAVFLVGFGDVHHTLWSQVNVQNEVDQSKVHNQVETAFVVFDGGCLCLCRIDTDRLGIDLTRLQIILRGKDTGQWITPLLNTVTNGQWY
jgi:hypothetical protein